jgi:hypothetical protein
LRRISFFGNTTSATFTPSSVTPLASTYEKEKKKESMKNE